MTSTPFDEDAPISVRQLRMFVPGFDQLMTRQFATDYDKFVKQLYVDIDEGIEFMERNRDARMSDSEDRTTEEIIGFLISKGYDASHDSFRSGHCDLTVTNRHRLEWLGEAKKHSDYEYLWKGFNQLSTRYSTGTSTSSSGGMLIYIRTQKPAADVMAEWRARLSSQGLEEYGDSDCDQRKGLAFFSTHKHPASGLPYKVRHMGVIMKFDPQDRAPAKAAKTTKIAKKAKVTATSTDSSASTPGP